MKNNYFLPPITLQQSEGSFNSSTAFYFKTQTNGIRRGEYQITTLSCPPTNKKMTSHINILRATAAFSLLTVLLSAVFPSSSVCIVISGRKYKRHIVNKSLRIWFIWCNQIHQLLLTQLSLVFINGGSISKLYFAQLKTLS